MTASSLTDPNLKPLFCTFGHTLAALRLEFPALTIKTLVEQAEAYLRSEEIEMTRGPFDIRKYDDAYDVSPELSRAMAQIIQNGAMTKQQVRAALIASGALSSKGHPSHVDRTLSINYRAFERDGESLYMMRETPLPKGTPRPETDRGTPRRVKRSKADPGTPSLVDGLTVVIYKDEVNVDQALQRMLALGWLKAETDEERAEQRYAIQRLLSQREDLFCRVGHATYTVLNPEDYRPLVQTYLRLK